VQQSLNASKPNLNILKVNYADDGSKIISVRSDPTKREVVQNSDGTTSFN